MRRTLFLALIALTALGSGLFFSSPADAFGPTHIQQIGPCSSCAPFLIDGNKVCQLQSCRETGITDPYGNEYVICSYLCRIRA